MENAKKILVADDEADIRTGIGRLLGAGNYEIATAEDGAAALSRLQSGEAFDLLILDIVMPRLTGLEVLAQIRERERSNLPVILLTAKSAIDDIAKGYNKGAQFYLTKPFEPRILLDAVEYLIGNLEGEEFSRTELELLTTDGVFFGLRTFTSH
jgi:CheY-like chemotaxis protein